MLLLPNSQIGEAWEPSTNEHFFANGQALNRHALSLCLNAQANKDKETNRMLPHDQLTAHFSTCWPWLHYPHSCTHPPLASTHTAALTSLTGHMHKPCGLGASRQCCHYTLVTISLTKQLWRKNKQNLRNQPTTPYRVQTGFRTSCRADHCDKHVGQPASNVGCPASSLSVLNWSNELIETDRM